MVEGRTHQTQQQQLNSLLASLLHWGGLEEVCLGLNYTPLNQSLIIEVEKGLVSATPPFYPQTHMNGRAHTYTDMHTHTQSFYSTVKAFTAF